MATVLIPNGIEVVERFTLGGKFMGEMVWCVNTLGATVDHAYLLGLNGAFNAAWTHATAGYSVADSLGLTIAMEDRTLTDLSSLTGPQETFSTTIAGGASDNILPLSVAARWNLNGGRGRARKGRKYFTGFTETVSDNKGYLNVALVNRFNGMGTTLLTGLTAAGGELAIRSNSLAQAVPVQSITYDTLFTHQIRRTRGV